MNARDNPSLKGFILTLGIAVAFAISIRRWVIEPYQIPNSVMRPTLIPGDLIFVWKWPYTWNQATLTAQRGDIAVFSKNHLTDEVSQAHSIRRIIGLPGDRVEIKNGHVILNGSPLRESTNLRTIEAKNQDGSFCDSETLPASKLSFKICYQPKSLVQLPEQLVPEGHLLVVGDWRSEQTQIQINPVWSLIPFSALEGKPWRIWLSIDHSQANGLLPCIRKERIFQKIE